MKVLRPDITNRGMETPEAADFPKITLVVAWPVSVPAVSPSPPPPTRSRDHGRGEEGLDARLGERRGGDRVMGSLFEMLAGPEEATGEAAQRPRRSHHVGARGETRVTEGRWALGFLRTLSWMLRFGKWLRQR